MEYPKIKLGDLISQGVVCAVEFISVRLNSVVDAKDTETYADCLTKFFPEGKDYASFCRYGVRQDNSKILYFFDHEI